MLPAEEAPGCVHHIHVAEERQRAEATQLCSCPAGLIHMHDCPVMLGLGCLHFVAQEGAPTTHSVREHEGLRLRLMEDYLDRTYRHRVQALSPDGSAWGRRRAEILARYPELLDGQAAEEPDPTPEEDAEYEREKERLIAQRRRYDEERRAREEKTKEEKAQARARMGIKTVVERARDAVEAQGPAAGSFSQSPGSGAEPATRGRDPNQQKRAKKPDRNRRRRRRRKGGGAKGGPGGGAPAA